MNRRQAVKLGAPAGALIALVVALLGPNPHTLNGQQIGQYIAVFLVGVAGVIHAPAIKKAAHKTKRKLPRRKPHHRPPSRPPSRKLPRFGLDWAWGDMPIEALHQVGASFACRYLSTDPGKNLQPAESAALKRAGIDRVVVWETSATRAADGHDAGRLDAERALGEARSCGLPKSGYWCIYFAIDWDAQGPEVRAYFEGVGSVLKREHIGAYGGIKPLRYLFDNRLIEYGWQTYAWSSGEWESRAQLLQFSNGHTVGGVDVDFDRAVKELFGQW